MKQILEKVDSVTRDPFSPARLGTKYLPSASRRDHLTRDTYFFLFEKFDPSVSLRINPELDERIEFRILFRV